MHTEQQTIIRFPGGEPEIITVLKTGYTAVMTTVFDINGNPVMVTEIK